MNLSALHTGAAWIATTRAKTVSRGYPTCAQSTATHSHLAFCASAHSSLVEHYPASVASSVTPWITWDHGVAATASRATKNHCAAAASK